MAFDQVYTNNTIKNFPCIIARGIGQVMFQDSIWSGILFLIGIFWGSYEKGVPFVAWGAIVGVLVSTITGYILRLPDQEGAQGLWGFNGALVGCAFPTFLASTVWMWIGLVICSALTTIARSGMDNILSRWRVSSFTFPFVLCTWIFLLSAHMFDGFPAIDTGSPEFPHGDMVPVSMAFADLVIYWLRGISQVFLINSWICGIFFLAGLAVCNRRAALWAAISSAIALFIAFLWCGPVVDISNGLYGFSPVLTGIALGAVFCNNSWRCAVWTVLGVVVTVFMQAAMNAFFAPTGLPALTGPFCVTTWIFLLPAYKFFRK